MGIEIFWVEGYSIFSSSFAGPLLLTDPLLLIRVDLQTDGIYCLHDNKIRFTQGEKMAGTVSLTTIVLCCDGEVFYNVVQRYLQTLISIGVGEPDLLQWGKGLRWPAPDKQINAEWPRLIMKEKDELFEAYLTLYMWVEANGNREKLILSLDFDMERVIGPGAPFDPHQMCYKRSFGQLIWRIMQVISAQVPGYGCYLEDEASKGLLTAIENGDRKNFWWVSLGIAPQKIYKHYLPAPEEIVVQYRDKIVIFALRTHWEVLPWDE